MDAVLCELFDALRRVRELVEMLPVCGSCKSIRDRAGSWRRMEEFFSEALQVRFTHGLCPDCTGQLLASLEEEERSAR